MDHRPARARMVETQLAARGISDPRVLEAMREVPRHEFIPAPWRAQAYGDGAVPIGLGQTISQPWIVARMAEAAQLGPADRVLDVGTGSGYAAAVLSLLCANVYSIERHGVLAREAAELLARLGYGNVEVRTGDGTLGWPSAAPFDAILVAAASPDVPPALLQQLAPGGRLVIPLGDPHNGQTLVRLTRGSDPDAAYEHADLGSVKFVPLVSDAAAG